MELKILRMNQCSEFYIHLAIKGDSWIYFHYMYSFYGCVPLKWKSVKAEKNATGLH